MDGVNGKHTGAKKDKVERVWEGLFCFLQIGGTVVGGWLQVDFAEI